MEKSILKSTKKVLGVDDSFTAFDGDILTHINSTFGHLNQIGVGPLAGFAIEDDEAKWEDLDLPVDQIGLTRTYIYLKVRMLFDPPTTSYLLDAMKQQILEHEWRLCAMAMIPTSEEEVIVP